MKTVKILLIDDSEMMLTYVGALLRGRGHEVVTAASLMTAVEAYGRHQPQAVLCDFVLGSGTTALDVLAAVFAVSGQDRPLAAILTQGALTSADAQRAAAWQVQVLQKPVRGQEARFLATLDAWLEPLSK